MKTLLFVAGGVALAASAVCIACKLFRRWHKDNNFAVDYGVEDENIFFEI